MTCEKLPNDPLEASEAILRIAEWNPHLMIRAGDCAAAVNAVEFRRVAAQRAYEMACRKLDQRTHRIKRMVLLLEKWQAYEQKLGKALLHETLAEIGEAADA